MQHQPIENAIFVMIYLYATEMLSKYLPSQQTPISIQFVHGNQSQSYWTINWLTLVINYWENVQFIIRNITHLLMQSVS